MIQYILTLPPLILALYLVATSLLALCAVLAWVFVWIYNRYNWERTPEGRHLMRFTRILGVTFTAAIAFQVLPLPLIPKIVISIVLYGFIAIELWTRIRLLLTAQKRLKEKLLQAQQERVLGSHQGNTTEGTNYE